MRILALNVTGMNPYNTSNSKVGKNVNKQYLQYNHQSNVNFGWCTPHLKAMSEINEKFSLAVRQALLEQEEILSRIGSKNEAKNIRYSLLDAGAAKAAKLFSQYSNVQYTLSEMIPTYALNMNEKLKENINKLDAMSDPIKMLITINNVSKLNMQAGIDKHTGKNYTENQLMKAKSGTKLYTVVLILRQLSEKLETMSDGALKNNLTNLYRMVQESINKIYGEKTYEKIIALSDIKGEITNAQKKESVALISELDSKAKDLQFSPEFEQKLKQLIDAENIRLGKTQNPIEQEIDKNIGIKLSYHTHAHQDSPMHHHHEHTHSHIEDMHHHTHPHFETEEEHIAYHERERLAQQVHIEEHN